MRITASIAVLTLVFDLFFVVALAWARKLVPGFKVYGFGVLWGLAFTVYGLEFRV